MVQGLFQINSPLVLKLSGLANLFMYILANNSLIYFCAGFLYLSPYHNFFEE